MTRLIEISIFAFVVFVGMSGLLYGLSGNISYRSYNYFDFTNVFEVLCFVLSISYTSRRLDRRLALCVFLILNYLGLFVSLSFASGTHPVDLYLSVKFLIYLVFLLLVRTSGGSRWTYLVLLSFVFFVVLKYNVDFFVHGTVRPGLFGENNFEMAALVIFSIFLAKLMPSRNSKFYNQVSVLLAALVSGSKSGLASFLFAMQFYYRSRLVRVCFYSLYVVLILLGTYLIYIFFDVVGDIDRVIFVRVALAEVFEGGLIDLFFGGGRLASLSSESCQALSYYSRLFSVGDSDICYSVVLHLFWLRVVIDHGLLMIFFVIYSVYLKMRLSGFRIYFSVVVIGVVCLNGLSVSGFGNLFVFFALLILLRMGPNYVR